MNLNFIELLANFQLITIENSSDGNNIKPKAIKRLEKFSIFYMRLSKRQLIILSSALECTRNSFFNSFIHSGHFYSTPSSPLLLRGAPDYSTDTVSEFHAEAHRQ